MPVFNEIDYDGRVQRIAEALSEKYDVTVFCLDSGKNYHNPAFTTIAVSPSGWRVAKSITHLWFWYRICREAVRIRPAVVHAHDYYLPLAGWIAARLTRARFVYDAHELNIPAKDNPLSRREMVFYGLEKCVVRRADIVVAANPERAEIMQRHYGLKQTPLVTRNIPPMPVESLGPEETLRLYPRLRRDRGDLFRLVYQGDMSITRGVSAFVSAMRYLDDRFQIVLAGGGPDSDAIMRDADPNRVIYLGRVPRTHLTDIMRTCDAGIVTYPMKGLNSIYCAPNKVHEYTQAGLPVIATGQPPLRAYMNTWDIGVMLDCQDFESDGVPREIASKVEHLAAKLDACRANLPAFLAANRWEDEKERLLKAYEALKL